MKYNIIPLEKIEALGSNSLTENLGIKITYLDEDRFEATMPVDSRTVQPKRILHGGASVALAETLGSIGGFLCLKDPDNQYVVGLEINANHIKAATEGQIVKGICKPVHVGRATMIFEIKIYNETEQLTCISRITLAVLDYKK